MAIDLASASAELRLDVNNFVTNAQRASDAAEGIQRATDNVTSGGFLGWVTDNEAALNRWGKGMLAVGGIITGALAAPIIAGSKAAWGQVDAVEQATFALRAYEQDASKVEEVLAGLISYARSDMGVLFQREDLFAAAQSLKIYGAETENLVGYVEIMSRSVGVAGANWDDLNRVIGRIGATGKITSDDFEMLTKMGYQLDRSIVGQTVSWEELFAILDQGIPAEAMAEQAETIRGKSIRLRSSIRDLGNAFLGVDRDTSKFIEGGLGWQMMRGMDRLRSLFIAAAPAVGQFGNIIAAIGRPLGTLFDWLLRLPQPIQTAIVLFTGATGVLLTFSGALLMLSPQIAGAIIAFQKIGGLTGILGGVTRAVGALRVAMVGLFMNPAMLAAIAFLGTLILLYQTNFMGFGDAVDSTFEKVKRFFGLVEGGPTSKRIDVTASFDDNAHTITQVTLPDGTKVWSIVEDATGETFGQVLESYTDYDGTTYILIEPEDGGSAFWAKADLETSKPEKIDIPLVADPSGFDGTMKTITSATGHEVTVIIDGDGRPVGRVLDGIISDPVTGEKTITLELGNGQQFVATVDSTTESVVLEREITITANASQFEETMETITQWLDDFVKQFDALMRHDWDTFDWRTMLDLLGLESIIGTIETAIGYWNDFEQAVYDAADAVREFFSMEVTIPEWIPFIGGWSNTEEPTSYEPTERGNGVTATPRPGSGVNLDPNIPKSPFAQAGNLGGLIASITAITALTTPAVNALDELSGSNDNLDAASLRSNQSLLAQVSTMPVYTRATRDADQQTSNMASGMGRSFGEVSRSALSNFTSMQSNATSRTGAMQATIAGHMLGLRTNTVTQLASMAARVGGHILGMRTNAVTQLATMASGVNTQTSSMQSKASSNASSMATRVGGHILGMRTAAALQMGLMASSAETTGSEMNTGMIGWMAGAITRTALNMALMVAAVRNAAGPGYDAGYYAGSQVSLGFANGMSAYLGRIQGAAASMVAAASAAVTARAMISSPSRLFEGYGRYIGEGLEIGILRSIPDIGRAADRMLDTAVPQPAFNTPIGGGTGTTQVTNNYYQQDVKVMTSAEWEAYKQKSDRGSKAYAHLNDPDAYNYGDGP